MKEVVSVVFINDKNSILALKRSPHKTYYPNVWDTVVGKKEDDETGNECLRREVKEELEVIILMSNDKQKKWCRRMASIDGM